MGRCALSLSVASVMLLVPVRATAQSVAPRGVTIAYVSSQRITAESAPGRSAQSRLQALMQEKAAGLRNLQQGLDATRRQLAAAGEGAERTSLQQRELGQRTELERATAQAQAELQNFQRQLTIDLQPKVKAILQDLLKGTDIQLVLQSEAVVIWAAPGLDLTSAIIERLNATAESAPMPGGGRHE